MDTCPGDVVVHVVHYRRAPEVTDWQDLLLEVNRAPPQRSFSVVEVAVQRTGIDDRRTAWDVGADVKEVDPEVVILPLGRSPISGQEGLRTFGYPQLRPEAALPGELAFYGFTADHDYRQLALRSEEATFGFSGAPIWDPNLHAVVGMIKSIASGDPGARLGNTAIRVPVDTLRDLCPELRLPIGSPYRGLKPFTEEHLDYYFGREQASDQLLASRGGGSPGSPASTAGSPLRAGR
jgi:hypothetical protein